MKVRNQAEKKIEAAIMRNLQLMGFDVVKMSQPQRALCTRGTPDLYVRHRKYKIRLWLEVKTAKGKTSPFQDYWIGTELACGGHVAVVRCMSDVLEELKRMGVEIG